METATQEAEGEGQKPTYTNHDGFLMPKGFPVDGFVSGLSYKAQPNDLFVATYPKCGTTWMQHIVYLLLNDGVPIQADERLDQIFPHLEEVGADFVAKRKPITQTTNGDASFRLIKTHLYYHMTPIHAKAKYIFVSRNPKDCVVSFFHHTRGFEQHYNFGNGSFDTYFDLFLKGQVDFGDYFDVLKSWMNHREDGNVLFLKYEDLRSGPDRFKEILYMIANFLDPTIYPAKLQANDEELVGKILEYTSISSMKQDPQRWSSERQKKHTPFIRKGSLNEWNELLLKERALALDRRMKDVFSQDELEWLGQAYYKSN